MKLESYRKEIEIKDLFEKNTDYYYEKYKKYKEIGKYPSLNLYALILTPFWCIYRKMIWTGAGIIGIQLILLMLAKIFMTPMWIGIFVLSLGINLYFGYFGNCIYFKNLDKLVKQGNNIEVKYRHKFINDKAGVDMHITICWVIVTVLMTLLALS
ncbi:DUF2628 domain-containing protein [Peptostreptococcus equinus]|uniref:DUF2628 domain-containing protein n=1 Tax=Peptostreptococcus equinus TaxID=3003601 RepID=A0ABY7JQS9_9FIRM|nr:DUF2628 domain-containing protein [Peptostreptococcus sp. CBA3647]WAW15717.1 DUF2628 domain-containing protein [Peptostreptococcus sp. CBA3647]